MYGNASKLHRKPSILLPARCKHSINSSCYSYVPETSERQVSLPHFSNGEIETLSCSLIEVPSGHADMQTQLFVAQKPVALPWTTTASRVTKDHLDRTWGRRLSQAWTAPASPKAILSMGKGGFAEMPGSRCQGQQ